MSGLAAPGKCPIPLVNVKSRDSHGHCGRAATIPIEYGCVHEHVVSGEIVCEKHAGNIGGLMCAPCWYAGHPCPLLGRRLEVSAP